jgi:hypothetical protein
MLPLAGTLPDPVTPIARAWRKATTSQKFVQVGLVGGLVGSAIYLYVSGRRGTPRPPEMPAEPVERPSRTAARDRGTYR